MLITPLPEMSEPSRGLQDCPEPALLGPIVGSHLLHRAPPETHQPKEARQPEQAP